MEETGVGSGKTENQISRPRGGKERKPYVPEATLSPWGEGAFPRESRALWEVDPPPRLKVESCH